MENLHKKFVQLGRQKFKLTNELLAILPEIYKSGIYKKYASSIFEYAAKFGGLSHSAVEKRLRIEKHLKNKPKLREAIREVGMNKVAMIATLATPETEEAFVDKIRNMSKPAVQTLSKELRHKENISVETVCEARPERVKLELDEEMTFLFLKLKKKWGLSNKQVMAKLLQDATKEPQKKSVPGENSTKVTRYVPVSKKRKVVGDGRCKYPGCNKPSTEIHHQHRYSESKNHDSVIALCREHHEFIHNGLVKNGKLNITNVPTNRADLLYRKFRQEAML